MGKFSLEMRRFGEWEHKNSPQIPKRYSYRREI